MEKTNSLKPASIYIHIPFCEHKCIYCDFYSIITSENKNNFFSSLMSEIDYQSNLFSFDRNFISIFFGGGTPSLMSANFYDKIINHLYKKFSFSDKIEITIEANPGTIDNEKLNAFKFTGINRISIGVQSFNDNDLKFLTRIHNKQKAIQSVYSAAEIGFENISIDLIFNLPNQSKKKWLMNLQTAVSLPIKHISTYSLTLEKGTILNKMVIDGKINIQDSDYDASLYETSINFLEENKFKQYEISNFAKDGFECIHNKTYWSYKDYLGFGPSAHSFINGNRWWNFTSLKYFIDAVNKNGSGICSSEKLTNQQMMNEFVMLALRSKGLNLKEFNLKFGDDWINKNFKQIELLIKNNFIFETENILSLTKKGYAVCDEIVSKLTPNNYLP